MTTLWEILVVMNDARRKALQDAMSVCCEMLNEGDAVGDYGAGFDEGVYACIAAIARLLV